MASAELFAAATSLKLHSAELALVGFGVEDALLAAPNAVRLRVLAQVHAVVRVLPHPESIGPMPGGSGETLGEDSDADKAETLQSSGALYTSVRQRRDRVFAWLP